MLDLVLHGVSLGKQPVTYPPCVALILAAGGHKYHSPVRGSRITASSPGAQVQLIALVRASWWFPHVARPALSTHGDCKFTGAKWC